MSDNLAIYIHWPFCKSKCPYCDFNSHVRDNIQQEDWKKTYIKEINYWRDYLKGKNIISIFFGGGTPSLMPVQTISEILSELQRFTNFDSEIEITLEANPNSTEAEKFSDLSKTGINRISIGIQSLNLSDLKFLGREHNVEEALKSIELADKYFSNFSFDLMYGLPNQTLEQWEEQLTKAFKLAKYHISLYQLTIEKGTKFYQDFSSGKFILPDSDFQAKIYNLTNKIAKKFGYECYEISNYARKNFKSKHNLTYWRYENYLGLGAGAHSRVTIDGKIYSMMNFHSPEKWLNQIKLEDHALQRKELLEKKQAAKEYIMMSLRLKEGLDKNKFGQKLEIDLSEIIDTEKVRKLEKDKFLIDSAKHLRLTSNGRILLNQILQYLI